MLVAGATLVDYTHVLISGTICSLLSACAFAPGMKMSKDTTLLLSSGTPEEPATKVQIPITDISLTLIKELKAEGGDSGMLAGTRTLFEKPTPYTLGVGDVLQITVWDHPELMAAGMTGEQQQTMRPSDPTSGFVVDQRGNITFPYAGTIHVVGLRPDQAQQVLADTLAKVYVSPQVTLRVTSFRAKEIYVDGEVHTPGALQINDIPMTLYEAISHAGGFNPTADQSSIVLVRGGVSYTVNLSELYDNGLSPSNIVLKDGDLLRVLARDDNGVYVMGEVSKPVTAVPMKSGRLTLSQAISQAGSINSATADASQLYVIRGGSREQNPEVFHLDASSPVSMILANQFELRPNDIVYIDGNGLVRLSRVLNLLMPGINAGLYAGYVAK
jgi:polysaccharide export outer membrane protein